MTTTERLANVLASAHKNRGDNPENNWVTIAKAAESWFASISLALMLSEKHYHEKVEELNEAREAWQKDHMEMKRKIDATEQCYLETRVERDELRENYEICQAGNRSLFAKNEDLKATVRRLKEKLESVEPFVTTHTSAEQLRLQNYEIKQHQDCWRKIQDILPHAVRYSNGTSLVDDIVGYIQKLERDLPCGQHRRSYSKLAGHHSLEKR